MSPVKGSRTAGDGGMVTAELAMMMPALVLLFGMGVVAVVAVTDKLGCVAKARDIALSAARGGQTPGQSVRFDAGSVTATVTTRFGTCVAVAPREP
jgi:hypothetical protein